MSNYQQYHSQLKPINTPIPITNNSVNLLSSTYDPTKQYNPKQNQLQNSQQFTKSLNTSTKNSITNNYNRSQCSTKCCI